MPYVNQELAKFNYEGDLTAHSWAEDSVLCVAPKIDKLEPIF